jgi:hypothetical protein
MKSKPHNRVWSHPEPDRERSSSARVVSCEPHEFRFGRSLDDELGVSAIIQEGHALFSGGDHAHDAEGVALERGVVHERDHGRRREGDRNLYVECDR